MYSRLGVAWVTTQNRRERTDVVHVLARQRMVEQASRLLREVRFGLLGFTARLLVVAADRETARAAHEVAPSRQWQSSPWRAAA
jgi:predicted fused transcriptional regulator/phosphomethylpyrimidine kinase